MEPTLATVAVVAGVPELTLTLYSRHFKEYPSVHASIAHEINPQASYFSYPTEHLDLHHPKFESSK